MKDMDLEKIKKGVGESMRRLDEVRANINLMDMVIKELNDNEIDLEPYQTKNLILTNICQNLADINVSLAVIADKLTEN